MSVCTFFGHKECFSLDAQVLQDAIERIILRGADTFYVGNQGGFDGMVYHCLKRLRKMHPHIQFSVVLAYLPTAKREADDLSDTIYPEIEGHPKFAIERRNRWMIEASDICLCYINRTWGGAYKFARMAERRGLTVINLGTAAITPPTESGGA